MTDGRILIADDEPSVRDAVGYALEQEGFDVTLAEDGHDADRKLGNDAPSCDLLSLVEMMAGRCRLDFWGDVRACDVHISNLRQKIERDPQEPTLVLTVRGVGYRLA